MLRINILSLVFFCTIVRTVSGQSAITFSQLPADYQLFARDSTNFASVTIAGTVNDASPERLSVQVWRDNQPWARSVLLLPTTRPASFSIATPIRAERSQYLFRVYAHTGSDSVLVVERNRIVCGDFILLYGQSNAAAIKPDYSFDDTYLRNFTFVPGSSPADGQLSWYLAKQPYGGNGIVGWRLQELILEQYGIPTCVLNGAIGGVGIAYLSARNVGNPADPATAYGQVLLRYKQAQAVQSVRAIIWKQGEAEAGGGFNDRDYYSGLFDQLYKNWRQDYGPKPRIYLSQVNFLPDPNSKAGGIRDFQRLTKGLYPNLETIATVGTSGFDGIHYSLTGYLQTAGELFRQLARDLYGSADTLQINSPNIRKAYYNARHDSLTMVFDDRMQMVWPADSTLYDRSDGSPYQRRMADFIYLNGEANLVTSGFASQNRVILALSRPVSATALTYLPPFLNDSHTTYYDGVHLMNRRGMRAFTFENVRVADALPNVTFRSAELVNYNQVRLVWNAPPALPESFLIERSDNTLDNFRVVTRVIGTATMLVDTTIPISSTTVFYRIRGVNAVAESPASAALRFDMPSGVAADLQLSMNLSSRVAALNAPVRVTLTALNKGPATATGVTVENRLPNNLAFLVGTNVVHAAGVVSASITSIPVGKTNSWTYTVTAQQPGQYINAAQIVRSQQPDPNSQPDSGIADGEDDAARADFRTVTLSDALFISPNPTQRPLPPVMSNQPVPVPDKADLSLAMKVSSLAPRLSEIVSFTITVTNAGGTATDSLTVTNVLPAGLQLVDGFGWRVEGSVLSWKPTQLPVGESRSSAFRTQVISSGRLTNRAEISRASIADPDSTPGNGTANGEDDTAQAEIRVR